MPAMPADEAATSPVPPQRDGANRDGPNGDTFLDSQTIIPVLASVFFIFSFGVIKMEGAVPPDPLFLPLQHEASHRLSLPEKSSARILSNMTAAGISTMQCSSKPSIGNSKEEARSFFIMKKDGNDKKQAFVLPSECPGTTEFSVFRIDVKKDGSMGMASSAPFGENPPPAIAVAIERASEAALNEVLAMDRFAAAVESDENAALEREATEAEKRLSEKPPARR